MSEEMPSFEEPQEPEKSEPIDSVKADREAIMSAMRYTLSAEANDVYDRLFISGVDDFRKLIAEFNALPPADRGQGQYDHGRPLIEHIDKSIEARTPAGYSFTITLDKKGALSLSTSL
jgi:hypothetical protein